MIRFITAKFRFIVCLSLLSIAATHAPLIQQAKAECITPPLDLVSWWPGDGDANDIWDGNPGSLVNDVTFTTGKVGQAFSFDGIGDAVSIPDNVNLDLASDLTIEAWVRTADGNAQPFAVFVGKREAGNNSTINYVLQLDPGGTKARAILNGISVDIIGTSAINDALYHHVAMTRNSATGVVTLYVDGAVEWSTTGPTGDIVVNDGPLSIGAMCDNLGPNDFEGDIDEVSIYDRELSGPEIQAIFDAGSYGKCMIDPIPTLTEWGMIVFCILLLGLMTWVIVRRRKPIAAN